MKGKRKEKGMRRCRFCGSGELQMGMSFTPNEFHRYFVQCRKCGARGPEMHSEYAADEAWNDWPEGMPKARGGAVDKARFNLP